MDNNALYSALAAICGDKQVRSGDAVGEHWTHDWTNIYSGQVTAVVLPQNTEQVVRVLRYCNEQRIAVVPQGGHTGMCGAATPAHDGRQVLVAMREMNRIRDINVAARTITVESGCILETIQTAVQEQGLFFPLNLGAKGSCQIGGNLSTNAGGLNVLRYGNTRDLCLGLEAVLADGRVLNLLSGLRKNNTGYDLKNLLIGAEGTLGIITVATLKLFSPAPPRLTTFMEVPSIAVALELLNKVQTLCDESVSAFEIIPSAIFELLKRHSPQTPLPFAVPPDLAILLEISGAAINEEAAIEALMQACEELGLETVVAASSEKQRQEFWQVRELTPVIKGRHGKWVHTDVSVPLSALADFYADVHRRLDAVGEGLYIAYGHLGDGNLHIGARPLDEDPENNPTMTAAAQDAIYECVADYDGSFSAEHGIGQGKLAAMQKYKDPASLAAMRQIKRALDPHNILNPGRVLPAETSDS